MDRTNNNSSQGPKNITRSGDETRRDVTREHDELIQVLQNTKTGSSPEKSCIGSSSRSSSSSSSSSCGDRFDSDFTRSSQTATHLTASSGHPARSGGDSNDAIHLLTNATRCSTGNGGGDGGGAPDDAPAVSSAASARSGLISLVRDEEGSFPQQQRKEEEQEHQDSPAAASQNGSQFRGNGSTSSPHTDTIPPPQPPAAPSTMTAAAASAAASLTSSLSSSSRWQLASLTVPKDYINASRAGSRNQRCPPNGDGERYECGVNEGVNDDAHRRRQQRQGTASGSCDVVTQRTHESGSEDDVTTPQGSTSRTGTTESCRELVPSVSSVTTTTTTSAASVSAAPGAAGLTGAIPTTPPAVITTLPDEAAEQQQPIQHAATTTTATSTRNTKSTAPCGGIAREDVDECSGSTIHDLTIFLAPAAISMAVSRPPQQQGQPPPLPAVPTTQAPAQQGVPALSRRPAISSSTPSQTKEEKEEGIEEEGEEDRIISRKEGPSWAMANFAAHATILLDAASHPQPSPSNKGTISNPVNDTSTLQDTTLFGSCVDGGGGGAGPVLLSLALPQLRQLAATETTTTTGRATTAKAANAEGEQEVSSAARPPISHVTVSSPPIHNKRLTSANHTSNMSAGPTACLDSVFSPVEKDDGRHFQPTHEKKVERIAQAEKVTDTGAAAPASSAVMSSITGGLTTFGTITGTHTSSTALLASHATILTKTAATSVTMGGDERYAPHPNQCHAPLNRQSPSPGGTRGSPPPRSLGPVHGAASPPGPTLARRLAPLLTPATKAVSRSAAAASPPPATTANSVEGGEGADSSSTRDTGSGDCATKRACGRGVATQTQAAVPGAAGTDTTGPGRRRGSSAVSLGGISVNGLLVSVSAQQSSSTSPSFAPSSPPLPTAASDATSSSSPGTTAHGHQHTGGTAGVLLSPMGIEFPYSVASPPSSLAAGVAAVAQVPGLSTTDATLIAPSSSVLAPPARPLWTAITGDGGDFLQDSNNSFGGDGGLHGAASPLLSPVGVGWGLQQHDLLAVAESAARTPTPTSAAAAAAAAAANEEGRHLHNRAGASPSPAPNANPASSPSSSVISGPLRPRHLAAARSTPTQTTSGHSSAATHAVVAAAVNHEDGPLGIPASDHRHVFSTTPTVSDRGGLFSFNPPASSSGGNNNSGGGANSMCNNSLSSTSVSGGYGNNSNGGGVVGVGQSLVGSPFATSLGSHPHLAASAPLLPLAQQTHEQLSRQPAENTATAYCRVAGGDRSSSGGAGVLSLLSPLRLAQHCRHGHEQHRPAGAGAGCRGPRNGSEETKFTTSPRTANSAAPISTDPPRDQRTHGSSANHASPSPPQCDDVDDSSENGVGGAGAVGSPISWARSRSRASSQADTCASVTSATTLQATPARTSVVLPTMIPVPAAPTTTVRAATGAVGVGVGSLSPLSMYAPECVCEEPQSLSPPPLPALLLATSVAATVAATRTLSIESGSGRGTGAFHDVPALLAPPTSFTATTTSATTAHATAVAVDPNALPNTTTSGRTAMVGGGEVDDTSDSQQHGLLNAGDSGWLVLNATGCDNKQPLAGCGNNDSNEYHHHRSGIATAVFDLDPPPTTQPHAGPMASGTIAASAALVEFPLLNTDTLLSASAFLHHHHLPQLHQHPGLLGRGIENRTQTNVSPNAPRKEGGVVPPPSSALFSGDPPAPRTLAVYGGSGGPSANICGGSTLLFTSGSAATTATTVMSGGGGGGALTSTAGSTVGSARSGGLFGGGFLSANTAAFSTTSCSTTSHNNSRTTQLSISLAALGNTSPTIEGDESTMLFPPPGMLVRGRQRRGGGINRQGGNLRGSPSGSSCSSSRSSSSQGRASTATSRSTSNRSSRSSSVCDHSAARGSGAGACSRASSRRSSLPTSMNGSLPGSPLFSVPSFDPRGGSRGGFPSRTAVQVQGGDERASGTRHRRRWVSIAPQSSQGDLDSDDDDVKREGEEPRHREEGKGGVGFEKGKGQTGRSSATAAPAFSPLPTPKNNPDHRDARSGLHHAVVSSDQSGGPRKLQKPPLTAGGFFFPPSARSMATPTTPTSPSSPQLAEEETRETSAQTQPLSVLPQSAASSPPPCSALPAPACLREGSKRSRTSPSQHRHGGSSMHDRSALSEIIPRVLYLCAARALTGEGRDGPAVLASSKITALLCAADEVDEVGIASGITDLLHAPLASCCASSSSSKSVNGRYFIGFASPGARGVQASGRTQTSATPTNTGSGSTNTGVSSTSTTGSSRPPHHHHRTVVPSSVFTAFLPSPTLCFSDENDDDPSTSATTAATTAVFGGGDGEGGGGGQKSSNSASPPPPPPSSFGAGTSVATVTTTTTSTGSCLTNSSRHAGFGSPSAGIIAGLLGAAPNEGPMHTALQLTSGVAAGRPETSLKPESDKTLRLLHLPLRDATDSALPAYLEEACWFIDLCRAEGRRVVVFCREGRSRSSSVVIAYLMRTMGLSFEAALAHVRRRRPAVDPNIAFCAQLQKWCPSSSTSLEGLMLVGDGAKESPCADPLHAPNVPAPATDTGRRASTLRLESLLSAVITLTGQ